MSRNNDSLLISFSSSYFIHVVFFHLNLSIFQLLFKTDLLSAYSINAWHSTGCSGNCLHFNCKSKVNYSGITPSPSMARCAVSFFWMPLVLCFSLVIFYWLVCSFLPTTTSLPLPLDYKLHHGKGKSHSCLHLCHAFLGRELKRYMKVFVAGKKRGKM